MSLEQRQKEFIRYVYTPKVSDEQQRRVRDLFLSVNKPDPGNGMKVYRSNLIFGMLQALKDTYPFCLALLGENNFNFLGREYIYGHPSTHPDLTDYGESLGDFLSGRSEIGAWPFLADVARLEWALDRAFYAPGETSLSMDDIHDGGAAFRLKSSITLLESPYQLLGPWEIFTNQGLQALPQNPFTAGNEALMVFTKAGEPKVMLVEVETAALVRGLNQSRTLETVTQEKIFAGDPGSLSRAWRIIVENGWVTEREAPRS
jgi:hypothetical protein